MSNIIRNFLYRDKESNTIPVASTDRVEEKASAVAKQSLKDLRQEIDSAFDYPILIVPKEKYGEVVEVVRYFCKIEEEEMQDIEGHVCLRLKTIWGYVHALLFSSLLSPYIFKDPQKTSLVQYQEAYLAAHTYFDTIDLKPRIGLDRFFKGTISTRSSIEEEKKILHTIFSDFKGICLGEIHTDKSPKLFLVDHMEYLFSLGVRVLYTEFCFVETQEELKAYNQGPKEAELPPIIAADLQTINRGSHLVGNATFTAVIEAAHHAGIDIVGIDSGRARHLSGTEANYRVEVMDYHAFQIIQWDLKNRNKRDKYVVFGGAAHMKNYSYGVSKDPGLGHLLQVPIVEVKDSFESDDLSTITFETGAYVKIKRAPMQNGSFIERKAWAVYEKEELSNKTDISEGDRKKRTQEIEDVLLGLYKTNSTHLVKNLLAGQWRFLKNLEKTPWNPWFSDQGDHQGLYNVPFAREICEQLNSVAPSGVWFNAQEISGFIHGGICTAIVLSFLNDYFLFRNSEGFSSAKDVMKMIFSQEKDYNRKNERAIQAALNSIQKNRGFSGDFLRAKIEAILNLSGQEIIGFSRLIDFGNISQEHFHQEMQLLPNSVFFIRLILPTSKNKKGEVHGHSMALIKEGSEYFLFNPNSGMQKIDSKILYRKLLEVHLEFNTPILRIYQLAEKSRERAQNFRDFRRFQGNTTCFSIEEMSVLSPEARFIYSGNSKKMKELKDAGFSLERFASFHFFNIPMILNHAESIIEISKNEAFFKSLDLENPISSNILDMIFLQKEKFLALFNEGITFKEIRTVPEELIIRIIWRLSEIAQLKKAGIDWKGFIQTKCLKVFVSHSHSVNSLIDLHQAGITFEEIGEFSEEVILKIFNKYFEIISLKKAGIDWKKCVNTQYFDMFISQYQALIYLHQGGVTVEELILFSQEILAKILRDSEGIVELKKAGIDWKKCININWFDAIESNLRLIRFLIDLYQRGITIDHISEFPYEISLKILNSHYLMQNLIRSSVNWREFIQTKCFDIIRSDISLWGSLELLHKNNISIREIEEFPEEIILKILKKSFEITEWKIEGLDWRKELGII
jgi:hypothetical protein